MNQITLVSWLFGWLHAGLFNSPPIIHPPTNSPRLPLPHCSPSNKQMAKSELWPRTVYCSAFLHLFPSLPAYSLKCKTNLSRSKLNTQLLSLSAIIRTDRSRPLRCESRPLEGIRGRGTVFHHPSIPSTASKLLALGSKPGWHIPFCEQQDCARTVDMEGGRTRFFWANHSALNASVPHVESGNSPSGCPLWVDNILEKSQQKTKHIDQYDQPFLFQFFREGKRGNVLK